MYDELTMRVLSAVLIVGVGLGFGWEAFKVSKAQVEFQESSREQSWRNSIKILTQFRDLLQVLALFLILSVAVVPSLVLNSAFELKFSLDSLVQTLGICLVILGLVLGAWAFRALGELATERIGLVKNHRLVQSGPFRLVRHPLYGAVLLLGLGLFLLYLNVIFLLLAIPVFVINYYRAQAEEKLLGSPEAFGAQYQEYRMRTRRFIPCIF